MLLLLLLLLCCKSTWGAGYRSSSLPASSFDLLSLSLASLFFVVIHDQDKGQDVVKGREKGANGEDGVRQLQGNEQKMMRREQSERRVL